MSEGMSRGLTIGLWYIFIDAPWLVLAAVAFWDKLRVKKATMIWGIVLVSLFESGIAFYVRAFHFGPYFGTLAQLEKIAYYLLIVPLFLRGFRVHWAQLLYVLLFMQNVSTLINNASYIVNTLALGPNVRVSIALHPTYPLLIALMNIPAFLLLSRYFRHTLRRTFDMLSTRDLLNLCAIPVIFFIINQVMNNVNYNAYDMPMVALLYLLIILAGVASYFLNLRLVRESGHRTQLEAENRAMGQMLTLQQRNYAQLTDGIERTRAQRHDMRFHLSVLSGYLKTKAYETAATYLDAYSRGLEEGVLISLCENRAVDVLAQHFGGQIAALGIKPDIKLVIPKAIFIPDADLCIIFGNLFENALHSLKGLGEGAFFNARCEVEEGSIVVVMDNACLEAREVVKGIGLNSVTAVASKHGGSAAFECKDGVFRASVILYASS